MKEAGCILAAFAFAVSGVIIFSFEFEGVAVGQLSDAFLSKEIIDGVVVMLIFFGVAVKFIKQIPVAVEE